MFGLENKRKSCLLYMNNSRMKLVLTLFLFYFSYFNRHSGLYLRCLAQRAVQDKRTCNFSYFCMTVNMLFYFQIVSKLVSKGLVSSRKELHKKTKTSKVFIIHTITENGLLYYQEPWSEEELFTLKSLWQPSDNINASIEQLLCSFPGLSLPIYDSTNN